MDRLSGSRTNLLRISVLQDVAVAGGAGWFWDYNNPKDVMNGSDVYNFGRIDSDAGLVGDGAAAVSVWLHRGV